MKQLLDIAKSRHLRPATPAGVSTKFHKYNGLHDFPASVDRGNGDLQPGRSYGVHLRLDADLATLSADVFAADTADTDGDDTWLFSVQSEAIYTVPSDKKQRQVLAHCNPYLSDKTHFIHPPLYKAMLLFELGSHGRVTDFSLVFLPSDTGATDPLLVLKQDGKDRFSRGMFRALRLQLFATETASTRFRRDITQAILTGHESCPSVIRAFEKAGIGITLIGTNGAKDDPLPLTIVAPPAGQIRKHDLDLQLALASRGNYTGGRWDLSILMTDYGRPVPDCDETPPAGKPPLGTVPGLARDVHFTRGRANAVVFLGQLEEGFTAFSRDLDLSRTTKVQFRLRRIIHTIVHEMGHMLNLPHSWNTVPREHEVQRADPAAKSWMNYPSNWPYGVLDQLAHKADTSCAREKKRFLASAHKAQSDLSELQFTAQELFHLRHAPYHHIAIGTKSFADKLIDPPMIKRPSRVARLRLRLDLGNTPVRRKYFAYAVRNTVFQPLVGRITLDSTDYVRDRTDILQFNQLSGRVRILIRREYDDPLNPPDHLRRTLVYVPPLNIVGADFWDSERIFLTQTDTLGRIFADMPLIPSQFWETEMGNKRVFTLQAVYMPPSQRYKAIYSNQVSVRFERDMRPDPIPGALSDIIRHPRLSDLAAICSYFPLDVLHTHDIFGPLLRHMSSAQVRALTGPESDFHWIADIRQRASHDISADQSTVDQDGQLVSQIETLPDRSAPRTFDQPGQTVTGKSAHSQQNTKHTTGSKA